MNKKCKFCNGEVDTALVILESPLSRVVANYFPMGKMSLLAIPRRHITSITQMEPEEMQDLMHLIAMTVNKIKEKLSPEGFNIFLNEGVVAGQTVDHVHFHVVVRSKDDGLKNFCRIDENKKPITIVELDNIKELFY